MYVAMEQGMVGRPTNLTVSTPVQDKTWKFHVIFLGNLCVAQRADYEINL